MANMTAMIGRPPVLVHFGENTAEAIRQASLAGEARDDAQSAAAAALAAAGVGEYASTAVGLAGTTEGETFWVDQGNGTGQVYRHDAGPVATALQSFIIDPTESAAADIFAGGVPTTAALGQGTGGEFSGFQQPDSGAVLRDHHEIATEVLRVTDFGAVGDDVADDQPAFAAAFAAATARGGALVFVPDPSVAYRLEAGLTIPSNCGLVGQTPKHTRLHHAFNGDQFVMGEGAKLINLYIDGDGANFTGKCMDYQGSAGRQSVRHVRATDWDGVVMNFATNAGSQSEAYDCRLARTNAGTTTGRFAVVIAPAQQLSARPRKFSLIETDGTCAFSFGGSNNTFVSNSFIGDIEFNAESRAVLITGTRVANQLALTVRGFNNSISGSDISPQITIASSSDNIALQGNSYNNLPIVNNSGNGRNLIDAWRQSYTPTLTSGGTAPSLGDGTLVGYASCKGDTVTVTIILTVGSTTTLGSGDLRFSLPTWAPNSNGFVQVPGQAMLSRGSTIYSGIVQLPNGQNWVRLYRDTSGAVTFNSPATWAVGDTLRMTFTYMV